MTDRELVEDLIMEMSSHQVHKFFEIFDTVVDDDGYGYGIATIVSAMTDKNIEKALAYIVKILDDNSRICKNKNYMNLMSKKSINDL